MLSVFGMNKAAVWLRTKRGNMSYRQLARMVGLTHTTVAKAEEGEATEATWIRLAEYFEEAPSKVLAMAEKTKQPTNEEMRDEWAERTALELSRLPAESRNFVEHILKYLSDKEGEKKE